jgi:repressor LexA
MEKQLSPRQKQIFQFILRCLRQWGRPPTVREIAAGLDLASTGSVTPQLRAMERKGFLARSGRSSRNLSVPERFLGGQGLPLVGRVPAGEPILAESHIEDHIFLNEYFGSKGELFLVQVSGESMKDAGILDGDLVLVRRQAKVESDEIGVVYLNGEATVKRVRITEKGVRLIPANPAFEPRFIPRRQLEEVGFTVGGKVVGVLRRY